MKIRSVMSTHVVTISPETTLKDAAARLVRYGVSGLPVVDDGDHQVGVLSEADILAKEAGSARDGSSPRNGMLAWLIGDSSISNVERWRHNSDSSITEARQTKTL